MTSNRKSRKSAELKPLLEKVLADFPPYKRLDADPIQFPRWFFNKKRTKKEIEAVAMFSAMMAYGSAKQFIKKIEIIMNACNWQFLSVITDESASMDDWTGYRLSTKEEIQLFAKAMGQLILKNGSIKKVFLKGFKKQNSIQDGLISIHTEMMNILAAMLDSIPRGIKHLLPNPASGGCAKRWHMFLRWMVRPNDKVDMNLWTEVSPQLLMIPLDRHISKISRNLGLTARKADDWKTAREISDQLLLIDSEDPIKYDFSLCHLGISGKCSHGKDLELCKQCLLNKACKFGKKIYKLNLSS
jgi:uncharacterized protein (TIGR02757 family)